MISSIPKFKNQWNSAHVIFMTSSVWWRHECPCARHDARTHARQNFKMLKIDFWCVFNMFQTILNIWKILAYARPRARFKRAEHVWKLDISFFKLFWIPDSIIPHFHQFTIILIKRQGRTRVSKINIRACVYCDIHSKYAKMKHVFDRL